MHDLPRVTDETGKREGDYMRSKLKAFRVLHKKRQADIADILGVSRATYSFVERGERSGTAEFWQKLQSVFNVPDEQMYSLMKLDEVEQCEAKEKSSSE